MPGGLAGRTVTGQHLATHHSAEMAEVETTPLGKAQIQPKLGKMKSLHYISKASHPAIGFVGFHLVN